ncbi:MAG: P-II family nitrogen regulator [Candidatus Scalinduaceae bacterium]
MLKKYGGGQRYKVEMLPKLKLDLVVPDDAVDKIVKTIITEAKTGSVGDGKIFVSDVDTAYRIRTGEEGDAAIT